MADILKFTETPVIDESIEEYEYHEYDPITGTNRNNLYVTLHRSSYRCEIIFKLL